MSDEYLEFTAYLGERQRHEGRFVSDELMRRCADPAVTVAITLRGAVGFGPRHDVRSDVSLSGSEDLPVTISAVGPPPGIEALAGRAAELVSRGLVTLDRASTHEAEVPGDTVEVTVHLTRGHPTAYRSMCGLLHANGFDCATAFLGVDGAVDGERKRARFFGTNAGVPVAVVAVGPVARLPGVLADCSPRLVTVRPVDVCKRKGTVFGAPRLPESGGWHKLTVYTSETDLIEGEPIHRALVRALRATAGRGVTVRRGVWGFHGDERPHGDKLVQLGRHVPVVTTVIDTPDQLADHFAVIDELTPSVGVVTVAPLAAAVSIDGATREGTLG